MRAPVEIGYRPAISAVPVDYFCRRLLVDYLSTSRIIVDYFCTIEELHFNHVCAISPWARSDIGTILGDQT